MKAVAETSNYKASVDWSRGIRCVVVNIHQRRGDIVNCDIPYQPAIDSWHSVQQIFEITDCLRAVPTIDRIVADSAGL